MMQGCCVTFTELGATTQEINSLPRIVIYIIPIEIDMGVSELGCHRFTPAAR
jgi:hypothetical protein